MSHTSSSRFSEKRILLDARQMALVIRRMAGQLLECNLDLGAVLLVGIRTRGLPLAERLAAEVRSLEGQQLEIGVLDITLYRDDLSTIAPQPVVKGTSFPCGIDDRTVILTDDVLYTGRTIRAALDELKDFGRPRAVRLAVLVDRGHRELPIQADVVGTTVQTEARESVEVAFTETDGLDRVRLLQPSGEKET